MLGRCTGAVLVGVDARLVQVEVDLGGGLPIIAAVGLADAAVREGVDRIRPALRHAGFRLPQRRVTVNLAPAEVKKQGASLDLPIAAALLLADEQVAAFRTEDTVMVGELALDGTLRAVRGVLPVAMSAREAGFRRIVVPADNAEEAALVVGLDVIGLRSLAEVGGLGQGLVRPRPPADPARLLASVSRPEGAPDLADVRGQASARRALEIAAAGAHHLLLAGPPGAGKTMLARRLPGILPPMGVGEALECTRVWSAAGLTRGLVIERPFRAPHHSISYAGMTGGGSRLRPGEISLATHGVLYLDEMTEFRRDALESLRQPLEERKISLVRLAGAATFPADFTLVASMNPCKCGWHGSPDGRCECTPREVRAYRSKLSGPLLDRFDLVIEVPPLDLETLNSGRLGESSADVRTRVVEARKIQRERFGGNGASCNARMSPSELRRHAPLSTGSAKLLLDACERLGITARGFDRVRRVARTLADLGGAASISPEHVAEALRYRHPASLARS